MKPAALHIGPDRRVGEIQEEFNGIYPFLCIEFYKKRPLQVGRNTVPEKIQPDKRLGPAMQNPAEGFVELSDCMTTRSLEKNLRENYGLMVKLFRKSANLWMNITLSDNWTLKQQNDHGRELSHHHKGSDGDNASRSFESGLF
jgi:hypothetical protein